MHVAVNPEDGPPGHEDRQQPAPVARGGAVEVENLRMSGKSFDGVALDRGSIVPLDVGKATQVNAMIEPE